MMGNLVVSASRDQVLDVPPVAPRDVERQRGDDAHDDAASDQGRNLEGRQRTVNVDLVVRKPSFNVHS